MLESLSRQIKMAWQNIFRNVWLSLATVFIVVLSLFSISILFGLDALAKEAMSSIMDKVNVSLYFKPEVTDEQVEKVKQDFATMPEVASVEVITKEKALEIFKKTQSDNSLITQSLSELKDNPLSDSLTIKAKDISQYQQILAIAEKAPYSDLIWSKKFNDDYRTIANKMDQIKNNFAWVMLAIIAVFALISILIIVNTIRIGIYNYHEEIEIMRLVGATSGFIRAPFIWQSVFYGLMALVLQTGIFLTAIYYCQPYLGKILGIGEFDIFGYFLQNAWKIFGYELLGVLILNVLGSIIAMRKHLKV